MVLISDLMDKAGYGTALRYLVSRNMDVYVIQVLSAEEIEPDIQGDLRLVDCEDGDAAEVTTTRHADEALPADVGGFHRVGPAVLHPSRHGLSVGPQRSVHRRIDRRLPADAGVGAMMPELVNMLAWWQWLILAAVPPAIVLLYFLKLRRRPLEVPSTYLWHKSMEDLHVNALWQRLRRNLLLLLQLLIVLLAVLALVRPHWRAMHISGKRFILLIDNSASMTATDVKPSRLDEAKHRAGELVDQMHSGDAAMIISFADTARVEQSFTDDRRRLREGLAAIRPTARTTSLLEALKVASGLANPGRSTEDTATSGSPRRCRPSS